MTAAGGCRPTGGAIAHHCAPAPIRVPDQVAPLSFVDTPIADLDAAPGDRGDVRVMGHDHHGTPLRVQRPKHVETPVGSCTVQLTRGLVSQHNARAVGNRACDGDALTLPAGELRRSKQQSVAQTNRLQDAAGALVTLDSAGAGGLERQHDVFDCGQVIQQMETLEHEAKRAQANARPVGVAQRPDVLAIEAHRAFARRIEQADQLQERALARTGGAHDGDQLTRLDAHADVAQRDHITVANAVRSPDVVHLELHAYTSRSTSTGSTDAALRAGKTPDTTPSAAAIRKIRRNSWTSARYSDSRPYCPATSTLINAPIPRLSATATRPAATVIMTASSATVRIIHSAGKPIARSTANSARRSVTEWPSIVLTKSPAMASVRVISTQSMAIPLALACWAWLTS